MQYAILFLNSYFMFYTWKCANKSFNENQSFAGWSYIFLSALNGAAVASQIF